MGNAGSDPKITAPLTYVSRRWRGLWLAVDAVQDLVEALKSGEAWAVAGAARTLAGGVEIPAGARIAVAPRSRPEHASLEPLAQQLATLVGGIAEPGLLRRAKPVASSRLLRRQGLRGLAVSDHIATIRPPDRGATGPIVVIDDVTTSGATLRACEHVRRAAGCSGPITLAALARTARPPFPRRPADGQ